MHHLNKSRYGVDRSLYKSDFSFRHGSLKLEYIANTIIYVYFLNVSSVMIILTVFSLSKYGLKIPKYNSRLNVNNIKIQLLTFR